MKRSAPIRSRGFQAMDPEVLRQRRAASRAANIDMLLATTGRHAVMGGATSGTPLAKERASQSQAYQVAVRAIGYCMRCGATLIPRTGAAQFCHRDQGKGTSLKTDVRGGWCGCASCHRIVGMSGLLPKPLRRLVEDFLAWKTRCALRRMGLWPKSLPDTWRVVDETPIPNPERP